MDLGQERETESADQVSQIYQIVKKLADEQAQYENGGKRLTVPIVYDSIKNSNSSLKRRSKKLLQDSIEKILLVLREEQDDSDSLDGDFDGIDEEPPPLKVREFRMLRLIGQQS
jgi:ribosome biogenesis ATPase